VITPSIKACAGAEFWPDTTAHRRKAASSDKVKREYTAGNPAAIIPRHPNQSREGRQNLQNEKPRPANPVLRVRDFFVIARNRIQFHNDFQRLSEATPRKKESRTEGSYPQKVKEQMAQAGAKKYSMSFKVNEGRIRPALISNQYSI
jgi:hypothetical protein